MLRRVMCIQALSAVFSKNDVQYYRGGPGESEGHGGPVGSEGHGGPVGTEGHGGPVGTEGHKWFCTYSKVFIFGNVRKQHVKTRDRDRDRDRDSDREVARKWQQHVAYAMWCGRNTQYTKHMQPPPHRPSQTHLVRFVAPTREIQYIGDVR